MIQVILGLRHIKLITAIAIDYYQVIEHSYVGLEHVKYKAYHS